MSTASRLGSRFRAEFIARIVSVVTGAILTIALARLLDPNGYGLLYLTLSFFGIIKLFTSLGIGRSAARYIAEYKETESEQIPHIIRISFVVILFLTTVVAVAVILGRQYIIYFLNEPELLPFIFVGLVFLIFTTFLEYSRQIFQGLEKIKLAALVRIVMGISRLVFSMLLVIIGFGALGALVGYALSSIFASITGIGLLYLRFYRGNIRSQIMEAGLKRRIIEYAIPLTGTNAAQVLDKEIDTVLVGFFLNPIAVCYYVVSKQVVTFIEAPVSALGFTLAPSFAAEKSAGNIKKATQTYEEAFIHTLLLYIPAAAGIVLTSEHLVLHVFGSGYLGAVPVLQVLGFYAILLSINLIAAKALDFLGRARQRAIVKLVTSALNVLLNIILIPRIGVIGAAISTVITYSIYAVCNLYIINQELRLRKMHLTKDVLKIIMVTIVMSGVVFNLLVYVQGIISLLVVVGCGVIVWAFISSVIGLLDISKIIKSMR